ncbi:hypothetical protein [Tuberibacillus calidus]|uniref:hypothetical protein n=1 Tax=Tuberibacillus calidus TaxID=340097 RepID=UPI0004181615|nr:hypothetical protein [Tuberibacillus calidus]
MEKKGNIKFKDVIIEYLNGNDKAYEKIVKFKDRHEEKGLRRYTYYQDPGLHSFYEFCLQAYSKLGRDEIESLFQVGLYNFFHDLKNKKEYRDTAKTLSNNGLLKWAKKYIQGVILDEFNRQYGNLKFDSKTGKETKEIDIVSEYRSSNNYYGDDDDLSDSLSFYNLSAFQNWNKKNPYISFADFIKEINLETYIINILTDQQLAVYYKLLDKYQIENQKTYGNQKIAEELGISETRVRQIQETIGDKLWRVYQLWYQTKRKKNVPLSHEIRDFLAFYDRIIETVDDVNVLFEMLISWLKVQVEKEKQVNVDYLFNNQADDRLGIIDLISDSDSEFKEILLKMDKHLHKSTYITICKLISGEIDKDKLKKESKKTIITKCLNIFYTYLSDLDKDLNRIAQYITTFNKKNKEKEHYKGLLKEDLFNKKNKIK